MRVLLSAYACEPNRGGEPEVGWQRALHMLPFADEVWVLTRANNRKVIEADPLSRTPGLHFLYYDLPRWAQKFKKHIWFRYIYFTLWQWGAYKLAAQHHRERPFDRVYHVTFVSLLSGSFMGRLGIPFVIGPIAGGERSPFRLRRSMPLRGLFVETFRDLVILFQRCSVLTHFAFAAADRIYATTRESLRVIPHRWRAKTDIQLGIAIRSEDFAPLRRLPSSRPNFVYVGRLLHLKGIHFAIRALAQARQAVPDMTLTLIGNGPEEQWLRSLAQWAGVADAVQFMGQLPRPELLQSLHHYRALVFPSLHDSGGLAALEALALGLPVICLDLGGPGIMVNDTCGMVVSTAGIGETQIVRGLADAMVRMAQLPSAEFENLSQGATVRANALSWAKLTEYIFRHGALSE